MIGKIGLNNTQRQMLDEVYSNRFDKITNQTLANREKEYNKLCNKILKEESNKPLFTKLCKIQKDFYNLAKQQKQNNKNLGIDIKNLNDTYSYDKPELQINNSFYNNNNNTHPKLKPFVKRTETIKQELADKKIEIRAKIYGMDTTYEEIEQEINSYLSKIKQ